MRRRLRGFWAGDCRDLGFALTLPSPKGRGVSGIGAFHAAYVLAYRYFKRVSAHTSNIASSIVEPLDKLDFPAKPETEESEAVE